MHRWLRRRCKMLEDSSRSLLPLLCIITIFPAVNNGFRHHGICSVTSLKHN